MAARKKLSKKAQPVTDSQISSLAKEAAKAGDNAMVKICGRALSGSKTARTECARVLMAARAMED